MLNSQPFIISVMAELGRNNKDRLTLDRQVLTHFFFVHSLKKPVFSVLLPKNPELCHRSGRWPAWPPFPRDPWAPNENWAPAELRTKTFQMRIFFATISFFSCCGSLNRSVQGKHFYTILIFASLWDASNYTTNQLL